MKPVQTLMLIVLTTFCQAECPIECYCDRITTCSGDNLITRFPTSIDTGDNAPHRQILRLEVHEYAVTHLSKQDFLAILSNLTEISISRNALETFDNDTFSPEIAIITSLASTIRGGGKSSLSKSSRDNVALNSSTSVDSKRTFSPPSSHSTSTTNTAFPDASVKALKLRILDLSQNKLKYFVGGPKLRNVKILDLQSNLLQQVYGLSSMQSLESLNLRSNRITFLETDIFQNLRNLQYVNLDSNSLRIIHPSTFSNLPALAHLILSSNPISNLLPGFYWNSRVQFVDVSNVGLTSVPTSLTKTVRDFRLTQNNLTIIRRTDFEPYPNVGLLVLDENAIEDVEDDAFGRLDFLSRLWMNGNRLKRIPQNLPPSLRSLQLEDNQIVNISPSDFRNLKNLQELNLHSNRITSLPPYVFTELTSLKNMDLRSNKIDIIYRNTFTNLIKLEQLDLSQNPIKVIVKSAFESLQKISLLHLSRWLEPVEFDVTSLRPLQSVQFLDLNDSPHFTRKLFEDGGISYFPNLIELSFQRCELKDNLNIVSRSLLELNVQSVKMNSNDWICEDLDESVLELFERGIVVDQPICAQPPKLKGIKISELNTTLVKASLNVMSAGGRSIITNSGSTSSRSSSRASSSEEEESEVKTPNSSIPLPTLLTRSEGVNSKPENNFTSASPPPQRSSSTDVSANNKTVRNTNFSGEDTERVTSRPAGAIPHAHGQSMNVSAESNAMTKPEKNFSPVKVTSVSGGASSSSSPVKSSNSSFIAAQVAPGHGHDSDEDDDNVSDRFSDDDDVDDADNDEDDDRRQSSSKDGKSGQNTRADAATSAFADLLGIDSGAADGGGGEVVPTQSYFDYPTIQNGGSSDDRDSSFSRNKAPTVRGNNNKGTNNSVSSSKHSPPPTNNSMEIDGNSGKQGTRPGAVRRTWSEETKTNDDNTIIDESSESRSRGGGKSRSPTVRREERGRGEEDASSSSSSSSTAQRSIDGFPPAYPDNDGVAKEAPLGGSVVERGEGSKGGLVGGNNNNSNNPKYSYLKLQQDNRKGVKRSRNDLPYDSDDDDGTSTHMAVIVKTLLISAFTCLGSILALFFISLAVYRYSNKRRRSSSRLVFPCPRRCSNEEGEEDIQDDQGAAGAGMMYTRFGRSKKSRRDSSHKSGIETTSSHYRHHHQDGGEPEVELSGITNCLYFENEDIYHIT